MSSSKWQDSDSKTLGSEVIELKNLSQKEEYDKVTVRAQVIKVADPATVGRSLTKQEITIADSTETALLTLWETDVNTLSLGQSYQFNRLLVRKYRSKYQLSYPASGASVETIDDLDDVISDSHELDHDNILVSAQTLGVSQLELICTRIQCKRETVQKSSEKGNVGSCQQCGTTQRLCNEKQTCKLFLEGGEAGNEHVSVRAYSDALKAIAGIDSDRITCEDLLSSGSFDLQYNDYHVITSISRP